MTNLNKLVVGVVVLILIIIGFSYFGDDKPAEGDPIKIGVITPLTGGVAYWGESSIIGVELAEKDLETEGINVEFIIEDGQLDPTVALNAAQKLVSIDNVDAIYSEFNPAAIAVTSFLKDKEVFHLYNAAPISPLEESENTYKTYLDYYDSCKKVADLLKDRGIEKVGVLKINLEFGNLCLDGIQSVFNDVVSEEYNPGESDFRIPLSKLDSNNVEVIFNVSFQPETLTSLRNINELGMNVIFAGLSEIVTPNIIDQYSDLLEGAVMFGLPAVSEEFMERIANEFPDKTIANYQALSLAYIHTKQIANAFNKCDDDLNCVNRQMDRAKNEKLVGFTGFNNRIAGFDVLIQEWISGQFIDIK